MEKNYELAPFAEAALNLLKGVVYKEEKGAVWTQIEHNKIPLKRFFAQIGIEVIITDASSGFAYLRQSTDDELQHLPKLLPKEALGYELSVLCVLLREKLEDFDNSTNRGFDLFMSRAEIHTMVEEYCMQRSHLDKMTKDIDSYIAKLEEKRIVRCIDRNSAEKADHQYKILRIIKAIFTLEKLIEFKEKIDANEANK